MELPKDFGKLDIPDDLPSFNCDPESSAFSEDTKQFFEDEISGNYPLTSVEGK